MLDIIDVPLLEHRPINYQQENWMLNRKYYWQKVGVFDWGDLHRIAERGGTLWRGGTSTYNGTNDRIPNSLGEPYDDYCYKLVAAVLEKE